MGERAGAGQEAVRGFPNKQDPEQFQSCGLLKSLCCLEACPAHLPLSSGAHLLGPALAQVEKLLKETRGISLILPCYQLSSGPGG